MEVFTGKNGSKILVILRWVGTLGSAALFFFLLIRQDWESIFEKSRNISLWALAASFGLYLVSQGFNTLRWCWLLWAQDVKISFWRAIQINWSGNFISNFLPSTIGGDGFRILAIYPYAGRKTLAIGSVMLDRVTNMAAMLFLIPVSFSVFGAKLEQIITQSGFVFPSVITRLFEKYFPKIVTAYHIWAARPLALFYAFLIAWPSNLIFTTAIFVITRQLDMQVSFIQVLSVQTISYFFLLLPISINGYGFRELTYTALYSALGVSTEQAATLALLTRFMTMLATLPGALWVSHFNKSDLEDNSDEYMR